MPTTTSTEGDSMDGEREFTVESFEHHRNGVCGYPFHVGIITDEDGSRKVFVHFKESQAEVKAYGWQNPRTAILDIDKLDDGVIDFGINSYRGDHYTDKIQVHIKSGDSVAMLKMKDADPKMYEMFKQWQKEDLEGEV